MKVRFGPFVLDSAARQLTADGRPRRLTPKAFALLELLLEQRPQAVSKTELLERLWPGTFVAESNVASLVNEVRDALGDDRRRPRYVRTVHRFGYAFTAAVAPVGQDAGRSFRVFRAERDFELRPGENVLGRAPDAAVPIEHSSVSRRHAVVRIEDDRAVLEDCQSKNGTFVGGARVASPLLLADGDEILVGQVRLLFRILTGDATTSVWPSER